MIAKFLRKINNLRYIMLFMQSTSVPCVGSIAAWNYYIRAHGAEVSYEVGSNNDKKKVMQFHLSTDRSVLLAVRAGFAAHYACH